MSSGGETVCEWGDNVEMRIPIPATLSHTGKMRWEIRHIDKCIAPIVAALNQYGIYTSNSCCGHGECNGSIKLHEGRELIIKR